ncbi:MAG: VanZ family protein [Candidatus Moranbacteria bacterium]|nr:VanZ family protein [Candidatus Moranbacteria bacterium]
MATLTRLSPIFLRGLPLLMWMGVIFFFSSLPGSEHPYQVTLSYYVERKGAHVVEYAVLMFLSLRFLLVTFPRETFKKIFLLAVVFSIAYGATDELHQFFVLYRGAKVSDVLVDGFGVLLMGAFIWFIMGMRRKKGMTVDRR